MVADALAAEKARRESYRAALFRDDSCVECGCVVADQEQHTVWHESINEAFTALHIALHKVVTAMSSRGRR